MLVPQKIIIFTTTHHIASCKRWKYKPMKLLIFLHHSLLLTVKCSKNCEIFSGTVIFQKNKEKKRKSEFMWFGLKVDGPLSERELRLSVVTEVSKKTVLFQKWPSLNIGKGSTPFLQFYQFPILPYWLQWLARNNCETSPYFPIILQIFYDQNFILWPS